MPGWPPFLSLPSGEGSKAFCQEEEHVPCHCCMHPGPVTVCKPSSLWGRVPRGDGTDVPGQGVEDVTQDRGGEWKGGRGQEGLGS